MSMKYFYSLNNPPEKSQPPIQLEHLFKLANAILPTDV